MDTTVQTGPPSIASKGAVTVKVENHALQHLSSSQQLTRLPEHLCFLIDLDEENTQPWTSDDSSNSRMSALKDALINFVRRKSNPGLLKHKYGIATFSSGTVHIVLPFTSSAEEFKTAVEALEPLPNGAESTTTNINSILSQLGTLLELDNHRPVRSTLLPSRDDYDSVSQHISDTTDRHRNALLQQQPDDHLTRCVLMYGRSREVPVVEQSTHYIPLLHSPQCFVDILYVHLRGNEENIRCQVTQTTNLQQSYHRPTDVKQRIINPSTLFSLIAGGFRCSVSGSSFCRCMGRDFQQPLKGSVGGSTGGSFGVGDPRKFHQACIAYRPTARSSCTAAVAGSGST